MILFFTEETYKILVYLLYEMIYIQIKVSYRLMLREINKKLLFIIFVIKHTIYNYFL